MPETIHLTMKKILPALAIAAISAFPAFSQTAADVLRYSYLQPEEPESKERGVLVAGRLSEERDGALLLSLLRLGGV